MTEKTTKSIAIDLCMNITDPELKKQILPSLVTPNNLSGQVKSFHKLYNQKIRTEVKENFSDVSDEEIAMRINLIAEEFCEMLDAFGVKYNFEFVLDDEYSASSRKLDASWVSTFRDKIDVVEVADAIGDQKYVLMGTDLTLGIDGDSVSLEIHNSNMTKLGEDGNPIYRSDGKILKGPDYVKPNIKKILFPE